jgi:hypothetical protein
MSFAISLLLFFLVVRYILPVVLRAALGPPPAPGQVRVDYVPPTQAARNEHKPEFRGGEYVDYEEVE